MVNLKLMTKSFKSVLLEGNSGVINVSHLIQSLSLVFRLNIYFHNFIYLKIFSDVNVLREMFIELKAIKFDYIMHLSKMQYTAFNI